MSNEINSPSSGSWITGPLNHPNVPEDPIIPLIEGDGIGVDITPAMVNVVDAAVKQAYGGKRKVHWWPVDAGEKAFGKTGHYLPEETLAAIRKAKIAIKGPLTTPVGKGFRSVNVMLRQTLELFACIRPVKWYHGVPSPVCRAEDLNIVIFRENMEDLYLGVEFQAGTPEAAEVIELANRLGGNKIPAEAGIGIKPISKAATVRITRAAADYAVKRGLPAITIVHKGNIMKFTEGAFRAWALEVLTTEYRDNVVTEEEVRAGASPQGKIVVRDRIADAMFQEILLHPIEHSVVLTSNLNGDYLSDAAAAQVGGLGIAPGANVGDQYAVFEATHGTAPRRAGQDKANPASLILSACMMLDAVGWGEAADLIEFGIGRTVAQKKVTYDLAERIPDALVQSTSGFAAAIIENMSQR